MSEERAPVAYDGSGQMTNFAEIILGKDDTELFNTNSVRPGWRYRIIFSKDDANKKTGQIVEIKKKRFGGWTLIGRNDEYKNFVTITNKDEIAKLQQNPILQEQIKKHLEKIAKTKKGKEALINSGNYAYVTGEKDMKNFPFDSKADAEKNLEEDNTPAQISPDQLITDYEDIFKHNLKYPIDMFVGDAETEGEKDSGSQDYVFFEQFTYRPPQEGRQINASGAKGERVLESKDVKRVLNEGLQKGSNINIKKAQGTCMLPIPNKLGISQGVNWGEGKVNAIEFAAFNAATNAVSNVSNNAFQIFTELNNLRKQGGAILDTTFDGLKRGESNQATSGSIVNAVVAKALLSRLNINVDVDQFITRQTGAAINPNLELLFAGPQLRTFSFQFEFAPNGTEEAREVRKIQRWFREGMLATKTNISDNATLFLGSPNVFRICYKNNSRRIKGLNAFKICALTSCEIDFTPDGVYQTYEDGPENGVSMPVRSQMALTFNELTPIFRNDYGGFGKEFNTFDDPTLKDVDINISGDNKFTEDDLGF